MTRFGLTDEQKLLQETARKFFQHWFSRERIRAFVTKPSFDRRCWAEMSQQGWLGVLVPEPFGGAGLGVADIFPILEEAGRFLVPLPLVESAVTAPLLLEHQVDQRAAGRSLEAIAGGKSMASVALFEEADMVEPISISVRSHSEGEEFVLNGEKPLVAFGADADLIIVLARSSLGKTDLDGLTLFAVPVGVAGLKADTTPVTDVTYRFAKLRFDAVRVPFGNVIGEVDGAAELLMSMIRKARVALCAEILGGCQKVLEMCVEYSKQRVQFGRPIGSFQAIKHRLADMYLKAENARSAAYAAAKIVDGGIKDDPMPEVAKAICNDAYRYITTEGIQVHGGIGFTWEHDLHLYFKRALRYRNTLGTSPQLMYDIGLKLTSSGSFSDILTSNR